MAEVSVREFNKDVSAAKRAPCKPRSSSPTAADRPMCCCPSRTTGGCSQYERSIVDWLSVDDGVDLEHGRLDLELEAPEL